MENNFIQMAASAGHAVAYTISAIFKHIIDCVQLYFTNGVTYIVLYSINCLWLVGVTLIFDGNPQIIVHRCQIAALRWPNDISSATDYAIFKNREQNIECSIGCMARSAVLLKPNVANILLFSFCEQKFVQHGPITIAIGYSGLSLFIFEEKWRNYAAGPKSTPNSDLFWVRRLFNVCVRVFRAPNATILFVYIAAKIKMSFVRKDDFVFAKIGKRIVAIFPRLCLCCNIASVYTTIFFLHTYIIGHYNPSVRIIDLVSEATLCCVR